MKAYVLEFGKKIEAFGEYPQDCLIANETLRALQKKALSASGIELADASKKHSLDEEFVTFRDSLLFTPALLREFVTESRKRKSPTVCALKSGITTNRTSVKVQDVEIRPAFVKYDLRYRPGTEDRNNPEALVIIDPDEFSTSLSVPRHIYWSGRYPIPMTDKFAIQVDHWANLWVANIVSVLAEGARLRHKPKAGLLLLAMKVRSLNGWRLLSRLNSIGSRCDIHPTAYIEGSVIGNGVKVGAGAIIRESVIGNDVTIGNGVVVEESVIGDDCTVLAGHIMFCVIYPSSFVFTGRISASLLGRETFVGSGVVLTDFRFDGKNVTVMKNGEVVDSGNVFLGACLGHGVYLGSGCIVAPGRAIPNGKRFAAEKGRIISVSSSVPDEDFSRVVTSSAPS